MSGPLVIPVLQFVSGAIGARTAMKGLKEGNFAKAILGGVTAYMGFSGLAAGSTSAVAEGLGTEAGKAVANETVAQSAAAGVPGATELATSQVGSAGTAGLAVQPAVADTIGAAAGNVSAPSALGTVAGQTAEQYGASQAALARAGYSAANATAPALANSGGSGFINSASNFVKSNPLLAYGGMQVAGSMMAGSGEQDFQEKQIADQQRREDEARKRREYWAAPSTVNTRYDPRTGQFVPV